MIRASAVAGQFYPAEKQALAQQVQSFLEQATEHTRCPKVIIAPHAGYIYSGQVAAAAYVSLTQRRDSIQRVVLLGPSHHVYLRGIALTSAEAYDSPMGKVAVDQLAQQSLQALPQVLQMDEAHEREHSLEVHLPFLQCVLDKFELLPLVVGECTPRQVSDVLDLLWGDEKTLIVISSDLSHFHDYESARKLDQQTSKLIEKLDYESIRADNACGCRPLNGLLYNLRARGLKVTTLELSNSGDTAGSKHRVVGYGAYAVYE